MTDRFPYLASGAPPVTRPIVSLRAHHEDGAPVRFSALLDTGALGTIFDRRIAEALGVRLGRKGADRAECALFGGRWDLQFEHVDLALVGSDESWTARVGFALSDALRMPFRGVLGSAGFFDRYVVTFAEYHGWVAVEHAANVPPV